MDKNAVFKNLLFDLDGTLTDPALGITSAAQYALGKMGIEVTDRTTLTWLIGPPLIGSFEEGFGMTNLQALEALSGLVGSEEGEMKAFLQALRGGEDG